MRSKVMILVLCILFMITGCKKDNNSGELNAVFSYSVSGFVATFTNFTDFTNYTGPYANYNWDFGDGDSSSASSPSHVYSKVGKFVVRLTATKGSQISSFSDTLMIEGPDIKIDGDFSDWKHVSVADTSESGNSTLLAIKTFAKGDQVYFFVEGTTAMNSETPFHFFFNTDGDAGSGYLMADYPAGSGAEYMYEGNIYDWGELFKFENNGDQTNFDNFISIASQDNGPIGLTASSIEVLPNGNHVLEFSFSKAALGNVKNSLGVLIIDLNSGWSSQGALPESGESTSKFLDVNL